MCLKSFQNTAFATSCFSVVLGLFLDTFSSNVEKAKTELLSPSLAKTFLDARGGARKPLAGARGRLLVIVKIKKLPETYWHNHDFLMPGPGRAVDL